MKKIFVFIAVLTLALMAFGQSIYNVLVNPSQNSYNVGTPVQIQWNFSGIPSNEKVIITLWREGGTQNICDIARDILISNRSYSWTIPETCTNPHTGQEENLLQGRIKIRVRWTNWGAKV